MVKTAKLYSTNNGVLIFSGLNGVGNNLPNGLYILFPHQDKLAIEQFHLVQSLFSWILF